MQGSSASSPLAGLRADASALHCLQGMALMFVGQGTSVSQTDESCSNANELS